jgi:pimeloyl-ACP methyl ester carboxylesterase
MMRFIVVLGLAVFTASGCVPATRFGDQPPSERLDLSDCRIELVDPIVGGPRDVAARCGRFFVPENRHEPGGRSLALKVIVLPARSGRSREPVFYLSGGPGQPATDQAGDLASSAPYGVDRDIVLMDVRGTGRENGLDCEFGGSDDDLQGYLEPFFAGGPHVEACRDALSTRADLRQYTTTVAMQDIDDLRKALGYKQIVIEAGSYGTRAAMTYIRSFGQHVRAAALFSAVPIENRAPLFHARAAQGAVDRLAAECARQPTCAAAFPDMRGDLDAILAQLRRQSARVSVAHPVTREPVELTLSPTAFADGLRVMLYSSESARRVPLLLHHARQGAFAPFAEAALESTRGMKQAIRTGLMLAFTCSEDVLRIRPDEIERETAGSFIGDARVRGQIAACENWPRGKVPASYYAPFTSEVPVLIVSGQFDPVTPPEWGEVMRQSFPNSVHVVVPRSHTPGGDCTFGLMRQLFDTGSAASLDTSCVKAIEPLPFVTDESSDTAG